MIQIINEGQSSIERRVCVVCKGSDTEDMEVFGWAARAAPSEHGKPHPKQHHLAISITNTRPKFVVKVSNQLNSDLAVLYLIPKLHLEVFLMSKSLKRMIFAPNTSQVNPQNWYIFNISSLFLILNTHFKCLNRITLILWIWFWQENDEGHKVFVAKNPKRVFILVTFKK